METLKLAEWVLCERRRLSRPESSLLFNANESVPQFHSEVQPLGPEAGPVEFGRRPSSPYKRSVSRTYRELRHVNYRIDLFPGAGYRADPQKRVANEELQMASQLDVRR
jgi:hypothetical protein